MSEKSPATKLPLAVRKNIRDEWEQKVPEYEAELDKLLGTPWKFDVNPLAIFPYAEEGSYGHNSLGNCIATYADGFIWQLKRFLVSHGDTLKNELNSVVSEHKITLVASKKFSYCGCEIEGGILRINFNYNCLGTNINDAAENLPEVVSQAPQPTGAPSLSFAARHAIKTDYDSSIEEILSNCSKILQNPKLTFEPGFEELGVKLKTGKDVDNNWERNLGDFAKKYYESFLDVIKREGFEKDEMLREGLEEGVPNGVIKLRLVDKLESGYNQILLDNGDLVMQTTPANWGTNIYDTAAKLVDIL